MRCAQEPRSLNKVRGGMPNHCQPPTDGKRVNPAVVVLDKPAQTFFVIGTDVEAKLGQWYRMPSEDFVTLRRRDGVAVLTVQGQRYILSHDVMAYERRKRRARRRS